MTNHEQLVQTCEAELRTATGMRIRSPGEYATAGDVLKAIRARRQQVRETLGPLKDQTHRAHRAACALYNRADGPLQSAEQLIGQAMASWSLEQERVRRAEEARLRQEQLRLEEERRIAEAEALEAEGLALGHQDTVAAAHDMLDAPIPVQHVAAPMMAPKVAGISHPERWGAEVYDFASFLRFVAETPALHHLVQPNLVELNRIARAQRAAMGIPGVRAVNVPGTAVRA